MECALCGKNIRTAMSPQEKMAAQLLGGHTSGYKCDGCGIYLCSPCFVNAANAQGKTQLKHSECGGMFQKA